MNTFFATNNFREILKDAFSDRSSRNAAYSLRAFARDLGISPGHLSEVLDNRHGLSRVKAQKMAEALGLNKCEAEYFCDLVESESGRNTANRENANLRLRNKQLTEKDQSKLSLDVFHVIADWHYMPMLELAYLPTFKKNKTKSDVVKFVAKSLKISLTEAKNSLERLLNLSMLEKRKSGDYHPVEDFTLTTDDIPSEAIRKYHQQNLNKASEALVDQSLEERDFSSITFSFDQNKIQAAKADIKKFRREFMNKYNTQEGANSVYVLNMQLFGHYKE